MNAETLLEDPDFAGLHLIQYHCCADEKLHDCDVFVAKGCGAAVIDSAISMSEASNGGIEYRPVYYR